MDHLFADGLDVAFDVLADALLFPADQSAGGLAIAVEGGDLLLTLGDATARLRGADLPTLSQDNFVFPDGGLVKIGDNRHATVEDDLGLLRKGGAAGDLLMGLGGDDVLVGREGDDRLEGGAGSDRLIGGSGADRMFGGSGNDIYIVDDPGDRVIDTGGSADLVISGIGYRLGSNIERLRMLGTADGDLTGHAGANVIEGSAGANRIDGRGGGDLLRGRGGDDAIVARAGDTVDGGTGQDLFVAAAEGAAVSLAGIGHVRMEGVDLRGSGANALTLTRSNVLRFSDDTAIVHGESGDSIATGAGWSSAGTVILGGESYARYVQRGVVLIVDEDIDRSRIGLADPPATGLGALDGTNGFRLDGAAAYDRSGHSVSGAGDVNGDGFDDLIVGAFGAGGRAGSSYVVFGRAGGSGAAVDLGTLDGTTGFRLDGTAVNDDSGWSVSRAGDVNGDGLGDLIVGARFADPRGRSDAGAAYVVFGRSDGFDPTVALSSLDGTTGFRLDGAAAGDFTGISVSGAADVNGDGFDDLIVGAYRAGGFTGASYVVFGRAGGFDPTVDLAALDGTDGFRLNGIDAGDNSGLSVSGAGDVNGDGLGDLIIGAFGAGSLAGSSYVVFGRVGGFDPALDLAALDGTDGFRLDGAALDDQSGFSVSRAGDVNGDGFADLIVGARGVDPQGRDYAGAAYVVFGRAGGFGVSIELSSLDGAIGFRLDGAAAGDRAGFSVSDAGDVNGDGFDDLIVGAYRAGGFAGASYVVFGRAGGFDATLDLAALDGTDGFRLDGIDGGDASGRSVGAAGDVNGDGFDDLIVGAYQADGQAGESYVVFGGTNPGTTLIQGTAAGETLTGTAAAESIIGGRGDDLLLGGGGTDVLLGGAGDDVLDVDGGDFFRLDGGTGSDTLRFSGDLDLGAIGSSKIASIEAIDLAGNGDQTLTLDLAAVLGIGAVSRDALGTHDNVLIVDGDADDVVSVGAGLVAGAIEGGYRVYTAGVGGAVVLAVDLDLLL